MFNPQNTIDMDNSRLIEELMQKIKSSLVEQTVNRECKFRLVEDLDLELVMFESGVVNSDDDTITFSLNPDIRKIITDYFPQLG